MNLPDVMARRYANFYQTLINNIHKTSQRRKVR